MQGIEIFEFNSFRNRNFKLHGYLVCLLLPYKRKGSFLKSFVDLRRTKAYSVLVHTQLWFHVSDLSEKLF